MQKFSDAPLSKCPSCGGKAKRLISRSSFQLKGSGWYLTDYAKKGSPRDTRDASGSSDSSSESTPSTTTSSSED
ncbi:MAG TPA: zinc ribbon domain-containing protein [Deltaproteobacteria bacterium]|nr:zinc ribbon domain-containing protein [Deltaproteobacteria bacterium]HPJ07446.1 zinc ribbon domain-containing protein [Deltaproteobacteria bacterium]HPO32933.1 zinc ribbon domain-containing protein [Deltaproteobacteria bacterium]